MSDRPEIKKDQWISIGRLDCVVANVFEAGNPLGDCEVVFNPEKPTNRKAFWSDGGWRFVETDDYGGYADRYPRLQWAVSLLKRGRYT